MIGRLRSEFRRLSSAPRGATVVVLAVVVLGAVVVTLAPTAEVGPKTRRPSPQAATDRAPESRRQRPPQVSAAQPARARRAAQEFLAGYLRFAYGRASAATVPAITPALRRELRRERVLVTPVERDRHPHVVSLTAVGRAAGAVVATALIDDGGVASYAVRLTLRQERTRWLVTGVDGG